jgi:chromosome segregation ATPase
MRLASAKNDLTAKQAAAEAAARNLTDAKKNAADKQKALAAATETQSALTTAIAPLKQIKEPTAEIKTALDSLSTAKSAADSAVEKLSKENAAAQTSLAAADQGRKIAIAALDLAKRSLVTAEADQKAFTELPSKLSKAAVEAKERLEKLTAELAIVQAQADAAEAELKQFTQAYGTPNSAAAASQVTAASAAPAGR